MSTPKILKETPISLAEVKLEIEKIKKRDKELSFRTQRTEEYLNQFANKASSKLIEALKKLNIARLKEEQIIKIADLMPRAVDDLKLILQSYSLTLTKDAIRQIVDEVNKF
jgi:DNA-directed RNA polymerase subunit F